METECTRPTSKNSVAIKRLELLSTNSRRFIATELTTCFLSLITTNQNFSHTPHTPPTLYFQCGLSTRSHGAVCSQLSRSHPVHFVRTVTIAEYIIITVNYPYLPRGSVLSLVVIHIEINRASSSRVFLPLTPLLIRHHE